MRLRRYRSGFDLSVTRSLCLVVRWGGGLSIRWWDTRRKPWRIATLWGQGFDEWFAEQKRKHQKGA